MHVPPRRLAAALAGVCAACASCARRPPAPAADDWYAEARTLYFGIPVRLSFRPADAELAARAWRYLDSVDETFNIYRAGSELARLNEADASGGVEVSADLAEALAMARRIHRESSGAFDATVGPLVRLWRDAARAGAPPGADAIAAARGLVGMERIALAGRTLTAPGGVRLDLGGIVKGLAVDRVVAMLREAGRQAWLVQVGGETCAYGASRRGRPHVIGVQHPLERDAIWTAVADTGGGISASTSGNYEQPVVIAGTPYYHIVDPRTGMPVDTRVLSVTVVFARHGQNALADGLSTACAVLGPAQGVALAERLGGEALIIVAEGDGVREHASKGWAALVTR